jgi:dihydroorotate dehydrogenase electron transfer subunit
MKILNNMADGGAAGLRTMPRAVKIKEVRVESELVKTFVLDVSGLDFGARAGQFVNVWIPGVNEKPISVALDNGEEMWLTIAAVGPWSKAMHEKVAGDKVGLRGPFGHGFECEEGQRIAMLAGGYGAAPLYHFALEATAKGCKVDFIVGARRADLLLYMDKVEALPGVTVHTATDDGSAGHHGYNTQVLEKLLEEGAADGSSAKIDMIATCGPEVMMAAAGKLAEKYGADAQISVERYMKCGFGVCGQCVVDGLGVPSCMSGPVMSLERVKQVEDFGKYHRDELGRKHNF